MPYSLRIYRVPAAAEDDFSAELLERGSLGCEVRPIDASHLRVVAYFPDPSPSPVPAEDLAAVWASRGVEWIGAETLEERDWLAEYRAAARPIEIGRRFLVDPRDVDDGPGADPGVDPGDRELLRIPARTAFGTGSHESTRLVVEWLEELDLAGLSVLDVGTGSGILSFVALRLGARRAVGFDLDPAAPLVARDNALLNRARPFLFAGRLAALRAVPAFDLALVNVLPERVLGEYPRLVGLLRPGARVVSSGNLWQRREELERAFVANGLGIEGEKRDGDWAAYLLRRLV